MHFGFFHLVYLFFLVSLGDSDDVGAVGGRPHLLDFVFYVALAAGFWRSHRASHFEHVEADLARVPNVGALMMLPYARVVPMHLCIIAATPLGGGAVWLFGLLKRAADLIMHKVEHRQLQKSPTTAPARSGSAPRQP